MSAKERDFNKFSRTLSVALLSLFLGGFAFNKVENKGNSDFDTLDADLGNNSLVNIGAAFESIEAKYKKLVSEIEAESLESKPVVNKDDSLLRKPEINEPKTKVDSLAIYNMELPTILKKVRENPSIFDTENDIEDLQMYYPIYRAAEEKTGVDWFVLWVMHQQESTVSRDPNAFGGYYAGSMQRDPNYHPQKIVDQISSDVAFLADLPQRHFDDWKEIRWAAQKIKEDKETTGSLLGAFLRYSAEGPAYRRLERVDQIAPIFQ